MERDIDRERERESKTETEEETEKKTEKEEREISSSFARAKPECQQTYSCVSVSELDRDTMCMRVSVSQLGKGHCVYGSELERDTDRVLN